MANCDTEATWKYHQQTSHSYHSVRDGSHSLDWVNQPNPFKVYLNLEPISLPNQWCNSKLPALATLRVEETKILAEHCPDLLDLAKLLYFCSGITKRRPYPGGEILFRAASCTGALYEIELYLVCGNLKGLPAGVYHFSPKNFALHRLRQGDFRRVLAVASGHDPTLSHAPIVVLTTGTYWRNAWKYRARTYRHFGWDNGTILANLFAISRALGYPARLVMGFTDFEVNQLLGLDEHREVALSLVAIGYTLQKSPQCSYPIEPLQVITGPGPTGEVDYPEMRALHTATTLGSSNEVAQWRGRFPKKKQVSRGHCYRLNPDTLEETPKDSLEQVVRRRGSSRRFTRNPISFRELSNLIYYSTQHLDADFIEQPGEWLNDCYLTVNNVDGLPPGAYFLHWTTWELELLREGQFREEMGYLGLEQELPADASCNVFFLADLAPILKRFGNRGYRAVQLEAGLLGGRLYLSAYAHQLGATGLTFYDKAVTTFFSPHAMNKSAIFLMAFGHGKRRELVNLN